MKLMICVPGNRFSMIWLSQWSQLLIMLANEGIEYVYNFADTMGMCKVRNLCLGGDSFGPASQKPFVGSEYDFILWLDSDIIFTKKQICTLLESAQTGRYPILCGLYRIPDLPNAYTGVIDYDPYKIIENKKFDFITAEAAADINGIVPARHGNFGFTMMQSGILESMPYPWFEVAPITIGELQVMSTEDASFCYRAAENGYQTYIDTRLIVGHEKTQILY